MSFSIIIPTIGRDTLNQTIRSLINQITADDEIIVVSDGLPKHNISHDQVEIVELIGGPHNDYGATARNAGLAKASKDYILFMDDDDCFTSDALSIIRRTIARDPKAVYIFQMKYSDGTILWTDKEVREGNVSSQMFCFPRIFKYAPWTPEYTGDFKFIQDLIYLNSGYTLIWIPEIIALIRPKKEDLLWAPELTSMKGELPC